MKPSAALSVALLVLATVCVADAQAPLERKPNIILILVDDMGWTGMSAKSDDRIAQSRSDFYQTPNLEKLAEQGMRFSRAYSPGPLCTPGRAGILTGKTPAELHMTTPRGARRHHYRMLETPSYTKELPSSATTIAEALRTGGYATAHLGKWHLGQVDPGEHGFDLHDRGTSRGGAGDYADPDPKDIVGITNRAVAFMAEQSAAGKPFYLQLSHYAVHDPAEASAASKARFASLPVGKRHTNVEYAAMTYDLDASIGVLLAQIEKLGLANNTYVVLMSDNGASNRRRDHQNTPLSGGKGTLYEGGIRVPFMVRGPGVKANTFCHEEITGCDLLPTFCEWAGIPIPEGVDGVSLAPLLARKPDSFSRSGKPLVFHYPHYGRGQTPQSAIIVGGLKLLKDLETGTVQLFDLNQDISETRDLAEALPGKAAELERLLQARLESVGAQMPTPNPSYLPRPTPRPTPHPG